MVSLSLWNSCSHLGGARSTLQLDGYATPKGKPPSSNVGVTVRFCNKVPSTTLVILLCVATTSIAVLSVAAAFVLLKRRRRRRRAAAKARRWAAAAADAAAPAAVVLLTACAAPSSTHEGAAVSRVGVVSSPLPTAAAAAAARQQPPGAALASPHAFSSSLSTPRGHSTPLHAALAEPIRGLGAWLEPCGCLERAPGVRAFLQLLSVQQTLMLLVSRRVRARRRVTLASSHLRSRLLVLLLTHSSLN